MDGMSLVVELLPKLSLAGKAARTESRVSSTIDEIVKLYLPLLR